MAAAPGPGAGSGDLTNLTFGENATVEAYSEAVKASLAAADSACSSILTAVISLATVYGAVLALVTPKENPSEIALAVPFVFLGAAAVVCMWAQSTGIEFAGDDRYETVRSNIKTTIEVKRRRLRVAVSLLGVGLVIAGIIVGVNYSKPPEDAGRKPVSITLSSEVYQALREACGQVSNPVRGTVEIDKLTEPSVEVELDAKTCPAGKTSFNVSTETLLLMRFV